MMVLGSNDVNMVVTSDIKLGLNIKNPDERLHIHDGVLKISGEEANTDNTPPTDTAHAAYFWHQFAIGPTISGYRFHVNTGPDTKPNQKL